MVCIKILSRGHIDELWCFCYQYTIWIISRLINRRLVKDPIVAWYNKNKTPYTIKLTEIVIWGCKIYIINYKQGKKALDPLTNTYPHTFYPFIDT